MKAKTLVSKKDSKKYSGRYVATASFEDATVITSGKDPARVHATAKKRGAKDPVVFYIPQKDMVHIY